MSKVFPDRPIEDIPNSDQIFHTIYDLDDRFQVAGGNGRAAAGRGKRERRERLRTGARFTTTSGE